MDFNSPHHSFPSCPLSYTAASSHRHFGAAAPSSCSTVLSSSSLSNQSTAIFTQKIPCTVSSPWTVGWTHHCCHLLFHMIPEYAYGWGQTVSILLLLREVNVCWFGLQIKCYRAILTSPLWQTTLIFLHSCSCPMHLITSRSSACAGHHKWQ